MAQTPKQDRNGVPGPSAVNSSTAQPGPSGDFAAVQSAAESAGDARKTSDVLRTPPSEPGTEWDAGLAVSEVAGEA